MTGTAVCQMLAGLKMRLAQLPGASHFAGAHNCPYDKLLSICKVLSASLLTSDFPSFYAELACLPSDAKYPEIHFHGSMVLWLHLKVKTSTSCRMNIINFRFFPSNMAAITEGARLQEINAIAYMDIFLLP